MDCGERWTRKERAFMRAGPTEVSLQARCGLASSGKGDSSCGRRHRETPEGRAATSVRPKAYAADLTTFWVDVGAPGCSLRPGACHFAQRPQAVPIQRHLHVREQSPHNQKYSTSRGVLLTGTPHSRLPHRSSKSFRCGNSEMGVVQPRVRALCCHDDSLFGISPPGCGRSCLRGTIPVTHTDHDLYESL